MPWPLKTSTACQLSNLLAAVLGCEACEPLFTP